jgi:hypothetical protein
MATTPTALLGQRLPFAVPVVAVAEKPLESQRRAYRAEAADNEVLFCVEAWTIGEVANEVQRITISKVRRATNGGRHNVDGLEQHCVGDDGRPQPTIHTHADGNCQFSPSDLVTIAARRAPFEGVQCGERHFIWIASWQVVAMANGLTGLEAPRTVAPPR